MLVRWTAPATDYLTHICDYTKERFGEAQSRQAAITIYDTGNSLQEMPHRGRLGRKPGTWELVVSGLPFIIVYRVVTEAVEIVRILHGSQQWP